MRIPTICIDVDGAKVTINKSDFIEGEHELWGAERPDPPADEKPDPVVAKAIHKGAGKWIVEVDGKQVNEGFLKKAEAKALAAEY